MTKPAKRLCAQLRFRSACASAQSHQSLFLCAEWVAKDQSFLHMDSEDSDQTGQMLGARIILLVLSQGGSFQTMFRFGEKLSSAQLVSPCSEVGSINLSTLNHSTECLADKYWLHHLIIQ